MIWVDCDGVLLDPKPRQVGLVESVSAQLGAGPLDVERLWQLRRDGLSALRALQEMGWDENQLSEMRSIWEDRIESDEWLRADPVLSGVPQALEELRARGEVRVLSARKRAQALTDQLQRLGLLDLIDEVRVVDPLHATEAKAEALVESVAELFVGDTQSDMRAAELAHTRFWGVDSGQHSRKLLSGAELMCVDLREVAYRLGRLEATQ